MTYAKLSDFIFDRYFLPLGVDEKYKSIYSYGCEIILSSLFNTILLFILGGSLHILTEMLCFLLTFIPLRIYGRGAHASTHTRCLVLFSVSMVIAIAAGSLLSVTQLYIPVALSGLTCCLFIQYRFSAGKEKILRYHNQRLIQFAFPWLVCLLAGIALFLPIEPKYAVISIFGIYVQSISLIIKNIKGE